MRICYTLPFLLLWCQFALSGQSPIQKSVFFDSGKSVLSSSAQQTLDGLIQELRSWTDFEIVLEGYTDDRGSTESNEKLAAERAGAVYAYLTAQNCKPRDVALKAFGETGSEKGRSRAQSRRQNRRVDIKANPNRLDDLAELFAKTAFQDQQTFTFSPAEQQLLTTPGGVQLRIPAHCFQFKNGASPTTPVTLRFIDATEPGDWILHNLITQTTQNALLQTAGMFHIEAESEGQALLLKEDASIKFTVPADGRRDLEMELFYGVPDKKTGAVRWDAAQSVAETMRARAENTLSMNVFNRKRYQLLDSLKLDFAAVSEPAAVYPRTPVFRKETLRIAMRRKPLAPRLREPKMPAEPRILSSATASDKIIRKAGKAYQKRLKDFEKRLARYEARWEEYRSDSVRYRDARAYYTACQVALKQYEDSLFQYHLCRQFNRRIEEHLLYAGSYALTTGLDRIQESAYYATIERPVLNLRNKLRRRLREQTVFVCRQDTLPEGNTYEHCFDPEREQWLSKGNARITELRQTTGYDRICNRVQQEYDGFMEREGEVTLHNATLNDLAGYSFEVARMGWINIDKFYKYPPEQRMELVVIDPRGDDAKLFVVCKEIRGVLPMTFNAGRYTAPPLPNGMAVTIVGLKIRDGKPMFFRQDLEMKKNLSIGNLKYQSLTLAELKAEMGRLDG